MPKLVRVSGTVTMTFTQVVQVDDDFDPELHEPDLVYDDIMDIDSQDICFDSVEPWSEELEAKLRERFAAEEAS